MNQSLYRSMNDQIEPSQELIQSTLDKAHATSAARKKPIVKNKAGTKDIPGTPGTKSTRDHWRPKRKWILALSILICVLMLGITIGLLDDEAVRAGRVRIKPTQVSQLSGEVRGSESQPDEIDSDWVKVVADNGRVGYVYGIDLDDEDNQPKTPAEALEYMERMATAPDRVIDVYAEDKKTIIGTFTIHN